MSRPTLQQTVPAAAVVNQLLACAWSEDRELDALGLHKLVYLCHGWHLGLTMRPLLRESVSAWRYGPLIESIYGPLQMQPSGPIQQKLRCPGWETGNLHGVSPSHPAHALIRKVWDAYKQYPSTTLATICHAENGPWHKTMVEHGLVGKLKNDMYQGSDFCLVIPDSTIAMHFAELAKNHAK